MQNDQAGGPPQPLTLGDIYFVLFRHKWKIIVLAMAGIIAGGVYYFLNPPPYQSEAKLFIRYVLDSRSPNPTANNARETSSGDLGESIIGNEIQILTSFDIFQEVATNIGPEKILAALGGGDDQVQAANAVKNNLAVEATDRSSVIHLTFHHPDPAIVQPVLRAIIRAYLDKHLEVHQSAGQLDDFLTEQTTQLRSQIGQTENELRMAKTNAGIISIEDSQKFYTAQIARIREALFQAQADLAEHPQDLKPVLTNQIVTAPEAATDRQEEYQGICTRLDFLRKKENDYLTQQGYTAENSLVREVRGQITETARLKKELEAKYPTLAAVPTAAPNPAGPPSPASGGPESALALQSKIKVLQQQLAQIKTEAADADQAGAVILNLQRTKQMQEGNYQYFATSLEQARIDESLGLGRVSNISPIQTPTPPFKDRSKKTKTAILLAAGGILIGLAWAFLIEFFLDTTIKRSIEVSAKLNLPLFLSIPKTGKNGRAQLPPTQNALPPDLNSGTLTASHGKLDDLAGVTGRRLHPFYDALRDRLMAHFESINLTRKPKLVAVTATDIGSGVSSIAAGLAASLSETGDGRVLLVDMNQEHGSARQFFRGQAGCLLDDALESEKRDGALVQENLYVVVEGSDSKKLQRVLPKRFALLVPKLKASDYDYIIFDMPPVSQTSVTARLAGLMDITLLVIESEKTTREAINQATGLLALSKANVGAVLNKTRNYVPARLHKESLADI